MICQPKQNKSLLSKLTEVESKPGYYFNGKSLHYTIYEDKFMKNSSTKNSNFHQKEPETNCSIAFEIKADVEKMDNKEKLTYSRGVPEQPFLWGMCRHDTFPKEKVEPVHSISPFQNGRSFAVKAIRETGCEKWT